MRSTECRWRSHLDFAFDGIPPAQALKCHSWYRWVGTAMNMPVLRRTYSTTDDGLHWNRLIFRCRRGDSPSPASGRNAARVGKMVSLSKHGFRRTGRWPERPGQAEIRCARAGTRVRVGSTRPSGARQRRRELGHPRHLHRVPRLRLRSDRSNTYGHSNATVCSMMEGQLDRGGAGHCGGGRGTVGLSRGAQCAVRATYGVQRAIDGIRRPALERHRYAASSVLGVTTPGASRFRSTATRLHGGNGILAAR